MRIGVNCYLLQAQIGGLKQYFITLFDWLLEHDKENEYVFFYYAHNLEELAKLKSGRWRENGLLLPEQDHIEANLRGLDAYFCPFNALWPRPVKIPSIVTLVDIQEVFFPEFFAREDLYTRAWHYPASTRAADRVVTISQFSKDSIVKYHGLRQSKVVVAHLCANPDYFDAPKIAAPTNEPVPFEKFVFYPANRWAHKNHDALLQALRILKERGEPVNAVFTGFDVGGGYPVKEKALEYGIPECVHTAGYVTVPQMAYLYRTAEMMVFPSLFEGFGMPPVEAMAAGCPVVSATSTCLPEICGNAAEFFDPKKPQEIADAILRVRRDPRRRDELIRNGEKRARDFSAEAMSQAHIRAFREAIDSYSDRRYQWQLKRYQPYHKWRVDKIEALGFKQSDGLYWPWTKKLAAQAVRAVGDLTQAAGQRVQLLPHAGQLTAIERSGLFQQAYYHSQIDLGLGPSRAGHYLLRGAEAGYKPNPIFDAAWYLQTNPDVLAAGWNPLVHFIQAGAPEKRNPHPLFDIAWYLEQYPDVVEFNLNPLAHYLNSGAKEGRNPHPLFQASYYLTQVQDYDAACPNPLAHYLAQAPAEARNPHPLFDGAWYLKRNPDVAAAGANPLVHYCLRGAFEGRDPNPSFCTADYLAWHPEVKECGMNPLMHFLGIEPRRRNEIEAIEKSDLFDEGFYRSQVQLPPGVAPITHYVYKGARLRLNPHPFFDGEFYLHANPDVGIAGQNPFVHYVTLGVREDRDPHPLFDLSWYLEQNPEVRVNPIQHYMEIGRAKGLKTNPLAFFSENPPAGGKPFDETWYLEQNADVAAAGLDPLLHYLRHGRFEGRDPNPNFNTRQYLQANPGLKLNKTNPLLHSLKLK